MRLEARMEQRLADLKATNLWRDPELAHVPAEEKERGALIDGRNNDYLGFGQHAGPAEAATERVPFGATASRLISGTSSEHLALEAALADWLRLESALLFSSAYDANLGTLSAVGQAQDVIFSDALNHASIIDGCRLSRARVIVTPHRDLPALRKALAEHASGAGALWVVTESYFGMDGTSPDLRGLRALCDSYAAGLIVDEVHALGVFGAEGRGRCSEAGIVPDLLIGGFGKAFGLHGGFVAGSRLLRSWLWNRARSLVFSTATSPMLARLTRHRLVELRAADDRRRQLAESSSRLAARLAQAGVSLPPGREGPVFPVIFGSEVATLAAATELRRNGVLGHPIRPPTVPAGSSRIRLNLRADFDGATVDAIALALIRTWTQLPNLKELGGSPPRLPDAQPGHVHGVPAPLAHSDESSEPASEPETQRSPTSSGSPAGRPSSPAPLVDTADATAPELDVLPYGFPSRGDLEASTARRRAPGGRASEPAVVPLRWVLLGTGTDVGKTWVAESLLRLLASRGIPAAGLKPIETGCPRSATGTPEHGDAARLEAASFDARHPRPHPRYAFVPPVTPSLAARRSGTQIDPESLATWIGSACRASTGSPICCVIESAGGAFSPVTDELSNHELSTRFGHAEWILVAPDRLGVLHELRATLLAMAATGRLPDWIVLNAPEQRDASSGTNAHELERMGIQIPILCVDRDDPSALSALLDRARLRDSAAPAP